MAEIGIYANQIRPSTGVTASQGQVAVTPSNEAKSKALAQEAIARLNTGDRISGKIVSMTTDPSGNTTAQVDIGNQTYISAKIDTGMSLQTGQTVTFQVSTQTDGSVNLNPLYTNTALDSAASKAISAAGLTPDAQTLQMVRDMMGNGMSIDSESLLSMSRAMNNYPNVNTSTLMQMQQIGLQINSNSITQFSAYQNLQHQVTSSINDIMNGFSAMYTNAAQTGNTAQAMDLYGALMKLFVSPEQPITDLPFLRPQAATAASGVLSDVAGDLPGSPEGQGSLLQENLTGSGKSATAEAGMEDVDLFASQMNAETDSALLELGSDGQTVKQAPAETAQISLDRTINSDGTLISQNVKEAFTDLLKMVGVTNDPNTTSQTELMKLLSAAYDASAHTSSEIDGAWAKLFASKEFAGLLNDAMSEKWMLKPEDVANKDLVGELYARLKSHTAQLTQVLSGTLGENNPLTQSVANLGGNIDFMNQLNQMFQYVQLPLKMQNGDANGDLYVYTNRKSLAASDGSVSALLHLDMQMLGPTDVFVKLQDAKVSTNFYLADDKALDLVAAHIDELNKRLQSRGYQMDVKMSLQEDMSSEDMAVEEMLKVNPAAAGVISQTSFDARA